MNSFRKSSIFKRFLSMLVVMLIVLSSLPGAAFSAKAMGEDALEDDEFGDDDINITGTSESGIEYVIDATGDELVVLIKKYRGTADTLYMTSEISDILEENDIDVNTAYTYKIGNSAFYDCDTLEDVYLYGDCTEIDDYAFDECSNLEYVWLPDTITVIPSYAFYKCQNLQYLYLPDSVQEISMFAFLGCPNLEIRSWPEDLERIEQFAFAGCTSIESVVFFEAISEIEGKAFIGCSNLKNIFYFGDEDSWADVTIENDNNQYLLAANVHYNVTYDTLRAPYYGHQYTWTVTKEPTLLTTGMREGTCIYCDSHIEEEELPVVKPTEIARGQTEDGVRYSFGQYYGGYVITILVDDGYNASYDLAAATAAIAAQYGVTDLNDYVVIISGWGYTYGTGIQHIVFPENLIKICHGAFYRCQNLKEIIIPDSVKVIEYQAFDRCTNAERIVLPAGLEKIESNAFSDCESINELIIPSTLKSIEEFGLAGGGFSELILPEGFEILDTRALIGSRLNSIVLPASLNNIGYSCFDGCDELEYIFYGGSEADWQNVNIDSSNDAIIGNAAIHYNVSESDYLSEYKGHTYEWTVTKEATSSEAGVREGSCIYCDSHIEEEIPMLEPQTAEVVTVHIEAEDYASATGGVNVPAKQYEGSSYITGFAKGDSATYDVTIAGSGSYTVDIRASIKYAGTKKVNVYVDDVLATTVDIQSTGSFATFQIFSSDEIALTEGGHTIKLEAAGAAGYAINWIELNGNALAPETQAPETEAPTQAPETEAPTQAPETEAPTQPQGQTTTVHIEAEDFASATGGVNVPAKQYENSSYITGFAKGDRASYNVNVAGSGNYTVDIRASIKYAGTKKVNIYIDDIFVAEVNIDSTGSFASFQTFSSPEITLTAGNHTLTIEAATAAGYAINWIELKGNAVESETEEPVIQPETQQVTIHVEAEDFVSVTGDVNVPAKKYEDSQYITGFTKGDSATYNVTTTGNGSFTVNLRASIKYAGTKKVNVYVDDVLVTTINIESTGSFASFQTFSSPEIAFTAGNHVLKLEAAGAAGYAINWIELVGNVEIIAQ